MITGGEPLADLNILK